MTKLALEATADAGRVARETIR
ncbi:MAG: hypothetical protein QOF29_924, partial [bacterium]